MADDRRYAEVKAGAFVLAALLVLVMGSLWIAGSSFQSTQRLPYKVLMRDSGGIHPGDRVRFAGVEVGRVARIELKRQGERLVVFHVMVDPQIEIKKDSTALITSAGFLGVSFLQIRPGSAAATRLEPHGAINGEARLSLDEALGRVDEISSRVVLLMDQTTRLLNDISGQMSPMLQKVDQFLSDENARGIRDILETVQTTLHQTSPQVSVLLERMDALTLEMKTGLEDVPVLTAKLNGLVDDVQNALGPGGERLSELLENMNQDLAAAGDSVSVIADNRAVLEATLLDVKEVVANLKSFSQQIKEKPFSLVRIQAEPDRRPGDGMKRQAP